MNDDRGFKNSVKAGLVCTYSGLNEQPHLLMNSECAALRHVG